MNGTLSHELCLVPYLRVCERDRRGTPTGVCLIFWLIFAILGVQMFQSNIMAMCLSVFGLVQLASGRFGGLEHAATIMMTIDALVGTTIFYVIHKREIVS